MLDLTMGFYNVKAIQADTDGRFLQLTIRHAGEDSDDRMQMLRFDVGGQGKALRLAGAINLVQQDDVSPIYPSVAGKAAA